MNELQKTNYRFRVGNYVMHDFSKEIGKIIEIRRNNVYKYLVKWDNSPIKTWYIRDVLVKRRGRL